MKKLLSILCVSTMLTGCSQYALVNSDVYNDADLADFHTFRIVTPADGKLPPGMEMVTYYNITAAIREQLVERGFTEDPNSPILVNIGLTVNKQVSQQAVTTPAQPMYPGAGPWVPPPPYPAPQVPDYNVMQGQGPGLAVPPGGSKDASGQIVMPTPNPNGGEGATPVPEARGRGDRPGPGTPPPPPGPVYNGYVPWFVYPRAYYWPQTTQIITNVYREGVLTMDIVDMQTKTPLYSSSVATILDNGDTQFRNLEGIAQAVKVLFSKFPVPLLPQYR